MSKVTYAVTDGVALVTVDNPPVNGFSHEVRLAILASIDCANADPAIGAIVLTGHGKLFSGGADIREFGTPKMVADPALPALIDIIDDNPKPVVAAIRGTCVGGGLEMALGCHYRIGCSSASVGLPEVKLGLLPGAGGTQRLPRAVGLEAATNMIVSGEQVPAAALDGLFDRMVDDEGLVEEALSFARTVAEVRPLPSVGKSRVKHPDAEGFLGAMRTAVRGTAAAYPAPLKCIEAIRASVDKPLAEGLALERRLFSELLMSPESMALRHFFFAEREAGRIRDLPPDTALRPVVSVGVIGVGTMGTGIAMNFLNAGLSVVLLETRQEALERGVASIRGNYEASLKKGKLTEAKLGQRMALLSTTLDYAALGECDLIIEAVFEEIGVKEQVFRQIDEVAKPGAILATNTSTLDVDRIASFTERPGDVIGLHFFSPANVMKLLEVVRGRETSPDVLATAMALAKKIRKVAVVASVCDGFIGNRMIEPYGAVAMALVEAGASPEQVDRALEKFGMAMGPFRMSDLAGNDIGWAVRKRKQAADPTLQYAAVADRLCEQGRFGQKTGRGWYAYPDGRKAVPDPAVDEMLTAYRAERGIVPRRFSDDDIVSRCVLALINEGAKLLDEGIAARASDIDIVYIYGYGFPVYRGGPMHYADYIGVNRIARLLAKYDSEQLGDQRIWSPADLLVRMAGTGASFATQQQ